MPKGYYVLTRLRALDTSRWTRCTHTSILTYHVRYIVIRSHQPYNKVPYRTARLWYHTVPVPYVLTVLVYRYRCCTVRFGAVSLTELKSLFWLGLGGPTINERRENLKTSRSGTVRYNKVKNNRIADIEEGCNRKDRLERGSRCRSPPKPAAGRIASEVAYTRRGVARRRCAAAISEPIGILGSLHHCVGHSLPDHATVRGSSGLVAPPTPRACAEMPRHEPQVSPRPPPQRKLGYAVHREFGQHATPRPCPRRTSFLPLVWPRTREPPLSPATSCSCRP